jgi:hypothetical protein
MEQTDTASHIPSPNADAAEEQDGLSAFTTFCSVIFYIASVVFLCLGLNALINGKQYVGGDAYNLIIDGTHATAHLTMAGATAIVATLFIVIACLRKIRKSIDKSQMTSRL